MKKGLVLSAFARFRNLSVLALLLAAIIANQNQALGASAIPNLVPGYMLFIQLAAAFGIYGAFSLQTVFSKKYAEDYMRKQKVRSIRKLNNECVNLAWEAKKNANATNYQRLKRVADAKNEILKSFFRGEHTYLKEKIVEQTLNLVSSYIRLLTNYCIRSKEADNTNISTIADRINNNNRRLSFTKDPRAYDDVKNIIEMDEKLLERIKQEKVDLEAINAKLDYMESLINMFKHQILSSAETEEMVEKLETAVNEAAALDSVLYERRRDRVRA